MPTYDVWYKNLSDGRAPEYAFLELDYKWAGELEAAAPHDVDVRIRSAGETVVLDGQRPLRTGDVLGEKGAVRFWILTPTGVWAKVEAFGGPDDKSTPQDAESA